LEVPNPELQNPIAAFRQPLLDCLGVKVDFLLHTLESHVISPS
jgi:hypothetical protein